MQTSINTLLAGAFFAILPAYPIVQGEIGHVEVATTSNLNARVSFFYRLPVVAGDARKTSTTHVLLLVPGSNGDGSAFLRETIWTRFADEQNLLLVGPTFQSDLQEIHFGKGYYYPALWSGKTTLEALDKIAAKSGVKVESIYLFGFSAGAHFVHRFANWQPRKVAAFVAYSAGWWDAPVTELRETPALILCGENDERYEPTLAFYQQGRAMGCPWVWRSYGETEHEITPAVAAMAQTFLAHYLNKDFQEKLVGDRQTYRYYAEASVEAQNIADDLRVPLPSRAVAEAWKKEK